MGELAIYAVRALTILIQVSITDIHLVSANVPNSDDLRLSFPSQLTLEFCTLKCGFILAFDKLFFQLEHLKLAFKFF